VATWLHERKNLLTAMHMVKGKWVGRTCFLAGEEALDSQRRETWEKKCW